MTLADSYPVPGGLIVFVGLGIAADLTPWPLLSMAFALAALLTLPAWWAAHRRRAAHIAEVRARVACDPLRVSSATWEYPW